MFTGQEHDEKTGLIYFGARFYDPDTARFINQDSYLGKSNTPPSLHRYLYAYSNPTVWVDPTGFSSESVVAKQIAKRAAPIPVPPTGQEMIAANEAGVDLLNRATAAIKDVVSRIEYSPTWSWMPGYEEAQDSQASLTVESDAALETPIYTTPIEEREPLIYTTPAEEREATVYVTPISEQEATVYETPAVEQDATVYTTPDQSDLIDKEPYLREQDRDESGRFKASTDIPESRLNRAYPWAETQRGIQQQAIDQGLYNPDTGNYIDPNTLEEIEGGFHYGHTSGNESWRSRDEATRRGMSQSEYNASQQDLEKWQIEDPKSNMGHKYELKK